MAEIVRELSRSVAPGIMTMELEIKARKLIKERGVRPSFLNYRGYPAVLCTAVNEEIIHTPPSKRVLEEGDIITLDMGIAYQGWNSDMAVTLPVGRVSSEKRRFLRVCKRALRLAIKKTRAGARTGDIGNAIEEYVASEGLSVIKNLCGHGIGQELHEKPDIPNFGKRGHGEVLLEGQAICIEPMIAMGRGDIYEDKKTGSFITKDRSLSAHFEHTLLIRKKDAKVVTRI